VDSCYFDSSALVKRYISEKDTGWVRSITDPAAANEVLVVSLTGVEVVAALVCHSPPLLPPHLTQALADFRHDFGTQYQIREVTDVLIVQAMRLAETHRLRGYDAVQLAAAMEVHALYVASGLSITFVSADMRLNTAAVAEGLSVDNPQSHP
jgi:predicted nucleic acid-binding protein